MAWVDIELPNHHEVNLTGLDVDELEYSMVAIDDANDGDIKLRDKVYAWSASTQSNIFAAFFWAYFVCMVPAGIISQQLGGRLVISTMSLGSFSHLPLTYLLSRIMSWLSLS